MSNKSRRDSEFFLEKSSRVMDWLYLLLSYIRDAFLSLIILLIITVLAREGWTGVAAVVTRCLLYLPGVRSLVAWYLKGEVKSFLKSLGIDKSSGISSRIMPIPEKGLTNEELLQQLKDKKGSDFNPDTGKGFAYVYTLNNAQFKTVQKAFDLFQLEVNPSVEGETKENIANVFFHAFLHENALNPMVFPSLRQFEVEVVAMTAWMLNGKEGMVGNLTSGGTESILMAMKTHRDRARALRPSIKHPEVVASITVHPAFEKAASYFDIKMVHVPIDKNYKMDFEAFKKAITPNTILLVGSAPEYCHGIIDPISDLSKLALEKGLPLHVDACFGGFMLPWVEKLGGYDIPPFDFRLEGVTSMSADVHKYGLGPKGSSVVLYRSTEIRRYQVFAYSDWPGGLFGSPGMSGTRPGGNIASSWAAMMSLGQDGYMKVAERLMEVTMAMKKGIETIPDLTLCGTSHMTAYAFTSDTVNVFAIADIMEQKGWKMERGASCLHCTILPSHTLEITKQFITNLKESVTTVKAKPELANQGSAGVYGMAGKIPERGVIKDFVTEFFNEVYTLT